MNENNKKRKIGVVIVNYNQEKLLENCLSSIEKQKGVEFVVAVVDNGSEDGSVKMVKEKFDSVKVLALESNTGFCYANNVGIEYVLGEDCMAVLLLNNDTELKNDFLRNILTGLDEKNRYGMVAAQVRLMNEPDKLDSTGMVITLDGLAKNRNFLDLVCKHDAKKEVFCPAGAAALFSAELLRDVCENGQYLDEDFEFYFEELDLGWRARLLGWKGCYVQEAIVNHVKSASTGPFSEFVAFYTNRNIFFNIIKNYSGFYLVRAFFLSFFRYLGILIQVLLRVGIGGKMNESIGFFAMLKVTVRGWGSIFLKIPGMLNKRRVIQSRKKVGDKEIRRWFNELGVSFFG